MEDGYYKTKQSVEEYIRLAKDVNGLGLIEKLKPFLPKGSSVLELGSGPGTDWRILSKDYSVIGSDNSQEFLNHLRTINPTGTFLKIEANSLELDQEFDGIFSNKVLHHLTTKDLSKSIKQQHQILKSNGIVCHSFWKGEGDEVFKGLFVNYHNEGILRKMFSEDFDILHLSSYAEFEKDDSLLIIGRKKH